MQIEINKDRCIGCQKCGMVCPSGTITNSKEKGLPTINQRIGCIGCAHCTDVCECGAVIHPSFTQNKIHQINYENIPTPEQLLTLLRARRSNRALKKETVPTELLEKICTAANLAPTASNLQEIQYTVITDPVVLKKVIDFTMKSFLKLYKLLTNPIIKPFTGKLRKKYESGFRRMKMGYESGEDPILRGATALIIISAPVGLRFAAEDSNLAYQNGSLMAQTLGVSQIYTGFVLTAAKRNPGKLEKILEMDPKQKITAGMALGIPKFKYQNYTDRKEIKITKV